VCGGGKGEEKGEGVGEDEAKREGRGEDRGVMWSRMPFHFSLFLFFISYSLTIVFILQLFLISALHFPSFRSMKCSTYHLSTHAKLTKILLENLKTDTIQERPK
jgi:hypothetical protein